MLDFIYNFLIFLIDDFVQFSIFYTLKTLVFNIWELIFDKRRGRSPLLSLKILRRSVTYLLWNYNRNQFELAFSVLLLLNRRMPVPLWYKQQVTFLNPKFD